MRLQLVLATLLYGHVTFAAVTRTELTAILSKPSEERISLLKSKSAFKELQQLAFEDKAPYQMRWRALTAAAQIERQKSIPMLHQALKNQDWFMRDAGLRALAELNPTDAKQWARQLLTNDKALIVRTTAVGVLHDLKDAQSLPLLWSKLYSKENFRFQQSLWIRRHIAEALSDMADKKDLKNFAKILSDSDPRLHPPAIKALQRLTGRQYASNTEWKIWLSKNIQ